MRKHHFVLFLLASLIAVSTTTAQTLDWPTIQSIKRHAQISVVTDKRVHCNFEKADSEKLFCLAIPVDLLPFGKSRTTELVFNRADIHEVRLDTVDPSIGYFSDILAIAGGGGWDANHQATGFGGVKFGGAIALDLQFDHIQGKNGFSTAGSAVIPMFRIPPTKPSGNMFLRTYAEPGIGYRAGGGTFGFYSSAKVMVVLFSMKKWGEPSPYMEFERRFPFDSPMQGDNRVSIGFMLSDFPSDRGE
jgi:hypothetical protein